MFYDPKSGHNLPHDPFKAIVSPRPIGWISSIDKEKNVNLAPYSFFNAIADNPPMVMFSTTGQKKNDDSLKDTLKNIIDTKCFVINIVGKDLLQQMNQTSGNYPKDIDEFILAKLEKSNCIKIDIPRVKKSPASLECNLYKVLKLPGFRNNMVIGKVVGVHINDKILKNGIFDVLSYDPIARMGYKDYTSVSTKFELERPK
ncbi:MAG: flavin reductase family protein [Paracoccaceae bacterium]